MRVFDQSRSRPDLLASRQSRDWPDEPCFEELFRRYYSRVVQVLGRIAGDPSEAEELAGDVFWKLYEQRGLWSDEAVGGWLYRTASHAAIDALRARLRRGRYEVAAAHGVQSGGATPLEEALRQERAHQVRATLAQLKPAQAQLLMLRSSGLSYKELAEVLDMKSSSIGTLLARAEAEFEKCYRRMTSSREVR